MVIDCPWRWRNWTVKKNKRAPEAKYRTMSMGAIAALPVRALLRPGGIVVAWATWPLISPTLRVIEDGWGLPVITGGSWAKRTRNGKLRWSTGFIFRSVCEPYLVAMNGEPRGIRGRAVKNMVETIGEESLDGVARQHSRKPDEFYALLDRLTPRGMRRADVFACQRRPGWDGWGDQLDKYPGA